jgi:hypothetical protein
MNKNKTRTEQLLDAFERYHKENPIVWELFQKFTQAVIARGSAHYSSKAIFERIRWHIDIETKGGTVKLNNNFTAYYARMFHLAQPKYDGFFRNRRLVSEDSTAYLTDIQVLDLDGPSDEETVGLRIRDILAA